MVVSSPPPSIASGSVKIRSAVYRSDVGKARKTNEDGVLSLSKVPLYAVADGTGGPEAGRVALTVLKDLAPQLAAKNADVARSPTSGSRIAVGRFLEAAFAKANTAVHEVGDKIRERRIATTLVAATVVNDHAFVAHVGDSRAYLHRDRTLRCLTNDHTLAAMQVRRGDITPEELLTSPFRHALAQALGVTPALDVDLLELHLAPGDQLLVTSNGLTRALSDELIQACLEADGDPERKADLLIDKVHEHGAPDNTTFVLITFESPPRPAVAVEPVEDPERVARRSFLFRDLNDADWHQIVPYLEVIEVASGAHLEKIGEAPIGFAVVAAGKLRLDRVGGEVKQLGLAGHFGALYLASDAKAQETVTALAPTQVYVLSRARFNEISRMNPPLGGRLSLTLLEALGNRLGVLTTRIGQVMDAANGKI
jgi:serine/threonine protein phosphatase PrpC